MDTVGGGRTLSQGEEFRTHALELLDVDGRQPFETPGSGAGEPEPHHPVVARVADAGDETGGVSSVDQPDRTVVAEQEIVGQLADGRPPGVVMAFHGQKELVLGRCQARRPGLLLAPALEAAQGGAQSQEPGVRRIRQGHRWDDIIVLR